MVSTRDAIIHGSLEFPNLIKLTAIQQDFKLNLEVYGMVCIFVMEEVKMKNINQMECCLINWNEKIFLFYCGMVVIISICAIQCIAVFEEPSMIIRIQFVWRIDWRNLFLMEYKMLLKIPYMCIKFKCFHISKHINVQSVIQTPKKKKGTPKKAQRLALQSPGGPLAIRTSSFTLMSALALSMNCVHKTHFSLDKVGLHLFLFLCSMYEQVFDLSVLNFCNWC